MNPNGVCNMSASIDFEEINDLGGMLELMQSLGVSLIGLQTLDQMKERVRKALRISEEAFSIMTETRKEVETRERHLLEFYESTDACLNKLSCKDYALLELGVKNLKSQMSYHKQRLERTEYVLLVAGKRDSKKSTMLSLILGEQLLPDSFLGTSSIICELRYGTTHKLIAHFKDADPKIGLNSKTIQLGEMTENSQQIFLQQISSFFLSQDRQGCDKVEIFWPNNLLKERIVIVDSPAFGKSPSVDERVKVYLSEAFAVICIMNSLAQQHDMEEPIKQSRKVCLDHQRETSSIFPLFLCNNWDQVPQKEADSIKHYFVQKLREYWPELDPDFQIIYISSPHTENGTIAPEEFVLLMDGIKSSALQSIKATLKRQWRWLDFFVSRMIHHMKMVKHHLCPSTGRKIISDLYSERLCDVEKRLCLVEYELQEHFRRLADNAVRTLSKHLQSFEVIEKFTSWTLEDIPNTGENWQVTEHDIQNTFKRRLENTIAEWEAKNHILSYTRSSLVQLSHQRFDEGKSLLPFRYLENSVITDDAVSGLNIHQSSNYFDATQKVLIGVTSPILVPVSLAVLVPVLGVLKLTKKVTNKIDSRKYGKDKLGFMVQASHKYLCNVAKEQQLWLFVEEHLKDARGHLTQVSVRMRELIAADKTLCQQLRDETRSEEDIKELYGLLQEMNGRIKEKMTLFFISEVQNIEISCNDLKWVEDQTSLLREGTFASVYRGTFGIPGKREPLQVAVKLWKEELNESTAIDFLSKTETLRKLEFPFIVKFFGTALLNDGDRLRVIHVMEICEENLMNHIFQNPEKIPGSSAISTAKKNVLCWAKDMAAALEFIHNKGIVHRGLKLEKILLSQRNVVKVSGFRLSEDTKMIIDTLTGTDAYLAPIKILYKADIYSFGIMLWEMWYGKRAPLEEEGHLSDKRPSFVQGATKPPTDWQDLMLRCWDEESHNRPDAAGCHKVLTVLSQEVCAPSL